MSGLWRDLTGDVWPRTGLYLVIGVIAALVVSALASAVLRAADRRRHWPEWTARRLERPLGSLLLAIGVWTAVVRGFAGASVDPGLRVALTGYVLKITTIATAGWLTAAVVSSLVDVLIGRYRTDAADNRVARRIRTQVLILRRVGVALITVVTVAAALLQFPSAQAVGTSLLASAGLASIVAGLAAQSTLGNVIAGMQLAFSGALRIDDVVVANGEWGKIEEITLTYVVLHVWDDTRLVLPSTYFTRTPFENWTRTSSQLMQAVEFDLDWQFDPQAMRDEMHRVLARTELWDHRTAVLQVTDAVDGLIRVRILVTAVDAPTLFDLRCFLREELVGWLRQTAPQALPRSRYMRVHPDQGEGEQRSRPTALPTSDRSLFSGDHGAEQRARGFSGPTRGRPPASSEPPRPDAPSPPAA